MYATGIDPFSGNPVFVERDGGRRRAQKEAVAGPARFVPGRPRTLGGSGPREDGSRPPRRMRRGA